MTKQIYQCCTAHFIPAILYLGGLYIPMHRWGEYLDNHIRVCVELLVCISWVRSMEQHNLSLRTSYFSSEILPHVRYMYGISSKQAACCQYLCFWLAVSFGEQTTITYTPHKYSTKVGRGYLQQTHVLHFEESHLAQYQVQLCQVVANLVKS